MSSLEPQITSELEQMLPLPDGTRADWSDVVRRAGSGSSWLRSWRRRSVVLVAVAVLAAVGAASAVAYHYLGPSPGFSGGLSSLNDLPQASWPSSLPSDALDHAAAATGLTPAQAARRLRLVQSGLSLGHEGTGNIDLYAFQGNANTGCLFITGPDSGGICLPTQMTSNPALNSIAWEAGGGNSIQTPGPLAVYGLVADDIREVDADINGTTRSIPIVNNSFYTDYGGITSKDSITLVVHFDDGTTRTFTAPNPYADNGPTHLKHWTPTSHP